MSAYIGLREERETIAGLSADIERWVADGRAKRTDGYKDPFERAKRSDKDSATASGFTKRPHIRK